MDPILLYCFTFIEQLDDTKKTGDCGDFVSALQRQFDNDSYLDSVVNRFSSMRLLQQFTPLNEQRSYPGYIKDFTEELNYATKKVGDELTRLTLEVERLGAETTALSMQYFRLQEKLKKIKKSKLLVTK